MSTYVGDSHHIGHHFSDHCILGTHWERVTALKQPVELAFSF